MNWKNYLKKSGIFSFCTLAFVTGAFAKCPSPEQVKKALINWRPELKKSAADLQKGSLEVKPFPVPGMCQVILKKGRRFTFYVSEDARYIFLGHIIDAKKGIDFTRIANAKFMAQTISKEQMKKLDKLVDFTYGNGRRVVYFITDPYCPFCKKAEKLVYRIAKKRKFKFKVILYPLEVIHPGATKVSVSLLCDGKGYEGLMEVIRGEYKASNECQAGKKKIEENEKFIRDTLKVIGVPAFVFPTKDGKGRLIMGLLSRNELKELAKELF